MSEIKITGEWIFEINGKKSKPIKNNITQKGYQAIADMIGELPSPYLVVGDDNIPSESINEVFRKAVSAVVTEGKMVRFRTQLLPNECNGDFGKVAIFYGASDSPGSGVMLNYLAHSWSKSSNQVMTIEARITVGE